MKRVPAGFAASLPLQLFTILALPLLILLIIVAFGSVTLHQLAMRDLVAGHDVQAVRGVAASLGERLRRQESILTAQVTRATASDDLSRLRAGSTDVLFDGGMAIFDQGGQLLAQSPRFESWQTSSPLDPDLVAALEQVRSGGDALLLPTVEPGTNNTLIAIVASPAPPPGAEPVQAIAATSLNMLGLPTMLAGLRTSASANFTLTTRDGLILYDSHPERVGTTLPDEPHVRAALRGESGADYHTDADGHQMIATFAPVSGTDWAIMQEERWTEMVSPLMRYSQAAPLVLLPGLAITALGVWFGIRAIVRPLQSLEARAARLASGDFESIQTPVGGIEEIQSLQRTLVEMAGQVQRAQDVMRHYIAAITRAQEEERLRLARELHDQTIQALIALDHREQVLKRYLTSNPAGAQTLGELRAMTAQAIDDLRRMIRAMRPIYLEDLGLVPALEMLAADAGVGAISPIRFEKHGTPLRLSPEQEIALYRVAQEALNNARRHSQAGRIALSIRFEADEVTLCVQDDGVGFQAPRRVTDLSQNGHFGLIGMYERATLIGADLTIQSAPGEGTTITLHTRPLQGEAG
jgi:signal transduction histidine kinase